MLADGATCFVHATTSSFHLSVCCCAPFLNTSGAGVGVMPTSGTLWKYVPSVLPGFRPAFLNWSARYVTDSSSPLVPGARPSNSSEDSFFVCASSASRSMVGSWPIGMCVDVDIAGAKAVGVLEPHDTAPIPPEPEHADVNRNKRRTVERFMTFSVYLPAPIRSRVASASTLVALTRSSIRQDSSG